MGYFITWAQPYYGWVLGVVSVAIMLSVLYAFRASRAINVLSGNRYRSYIILGYSRIYLIVRIVLSGIALIALWLALLRPQYPLESSQTVYEYGRDIVVAIDVSRSMLVAGESGNVLNSSITRIERARDIVNKIIDCVRSERVALVAFSGSALTLCPFTKDIAALRMFVDIVSPHMMSGGGTTSLSCALREAMSLFSQQEQRNNKLLVMITDGEDFSADLTEVRKQAAELGVHITIIGIGSMKGGPVPRYNDKGEMIGYQRDKQDIVISCLNEPLLRTMAQQFQGLYLSPSLQDDEVVNKLFSWLRAREAERGPQYQISGYSELFMWCIAFALIILLLVWV